MTPEKEKYYNKIIHQVDDIREKIFQYNNNLPEEVVAEGLKIDPPRTIAEEEERIFKLYDGKKLSLDYFYSHLTDFFNSEKNDIEFLKMAQPCAIIYNYTEYIIPEQYFYSFYLISLTDEQKGGYDDHYKELIYFIASRDRVNVYFACKVTFFSKMSRKLADQIAEDLETIEYGIAVYEDELECGVYRLYKPKKK